MHFYSIHVIAEYNLWGSEIICRQIDAKHDPLHTVTLFISLCKYEDIDYQLL